jgi:hypothetical protein
MIIYNITLGVENSVAADWVRWMQETHIPELLQTGLFTDYRLCKLLEQDEAEGTTFVAQYYCDSRENYDNYINSHAPAMREKMVTIFGDRVMAFRTVMEVL